MYLRVNGTRLYFDIEGAGLVADGPVMRKKPTLVLVHGGPGADHSIYKPAFSQLSDVAQIIYYDHRGNGRSDRSDPAFWSLSQWGDDIRGLCDTLGLERPIILGTSFGGFVAQSYAVRHPGHAGGLILVSTAAKFDFPAMYAAFGRIAGPEAQAAAEAYWENPTPETRLAYREICVPHYQVVAAGAPDWISRMIIKDETALHFNGPRKDQGLMDFRDRLKRIDCPVMVMSGTRDPVTPLRFAHEIAAHLPRRVVELREFDNAGHGIVGDTPEPFFAAIREFLGRVAA